jgi:copper(I)-binding protein
MLDRLTIALLSLVLAGPVLAGSAADDIQVKDPWAREVPPNMTTTAGFLTLVNQGKVDHSLVAARSPVAGMVELHTHINDNGVMRMRPVDEMKVPAGGSTRLQPGGLHLMIMMLKQKIKAGDKLPVTLVFEDGSEKQIQAEVRRGDMMMQHGMKHDMPMKR